MFLLLTDVPLCPVLLVVLRQREQLRPWCHGMLCLPAQLCRSVHSAVTLFTEYDRAEETRATGRRKWSHDGGTGKASPEVTVPARQRGAELRAAEGTGEKWHL